MGKNSKTSKASSITVRTSSEENLDVTTAGVKLPVTDMELAKGEAFTFYLMAENPAYDFTDVTNIALKGTPASVDFSKTSNRSFKLTSKAKTSAPEAVTVTVTGQGGKTTELTVNMTVKETTETVNALFSKSVIDAYPGATLTLSFTGTDAEAAVIEEVNASSGAIRLDKLTKNLEVFEAGDHTLEVILNKDSFRKKIYTQITSTDIVKVDPTEVEIHMMETAQLDITLSGSDFNITSDKQEICTVNKGNKTITPVAPGTAKVTVSGTRGDLTQSVEVNVTVRETVQPTVPTVINTQDTTVSGGGKLVLRVNIGHGDTLSCRVEEADKGSCTVEGNKITYTSHTPDDDETVTLKMKTTSSDDVDSEEVDYIITVKGIPTTTLEVPDTVTLKENESVVLDITTDAKSVTLIPSMPALLTVNSTTKTIVGKAVGTLTVTVKATAINMKPVEKIINVIINPADLNKPILKSRVLQVESGKDITLEFILDPNTTLDIKEATDAGEINPVEESVNSVTWTAPDIGEYSTYHYNFVAKAVREEYNLVSAEYLFQVLVIKPKDVDEPEEPETGLAMSEVLSIVKDERLTFKEKIDILKIQGNSKTREILNVLIDYEDMMSQSEALIGEEAGGAKNFELFTKLKYILELKENVSFQALFSLVNLVFKEYRESAYAELKLHRFEDNWPSNSNTLMAYKGLVTAIYMLCDISTRESNMRRVDFNKVFDTELEVWKDYSIQSFTKYYTY